MSPCQEALEFDFSILSFELKYKEDSVVELSDIPKCVFDTCLEKEELPQTGLYSCGGVSVVT